MTALELADYVEGAHPFSMSIEVAAMLRRQHEAIKVLREALQNTKQSLIGNTTFTYSPYADEVIAAADQALKDTEEFK